MPEGLREDPYHWTELPSLKKDDYYYYYHYFYYYGIFLANTMPVSAFAGRDIVWREM